MAATLAEVEIALKVNEASLNALEKRLEGNLKNLEKKLNASASKIARLQEELNEKTATKAERAKQREAAAAEAAAKKKMAAADQAAKQEIAAAERSVKAAENAERRKVTVRYNTSKIVWAEAPKIAAVEQREAERGAKAIEAAEKRKVRAAQVAAQERTRLANKLAADEAKAAERAARAQEKAQQRAQRSAERAANAQERLRASNINRTVTRVGAVAGSYLGIREVIEFADAWTRAGNRIAATEQITGMQLASLEDLRKGADETRSAFGDYVELYARIARAGSNVVKSEKQVAQITNTVAKAFKAGGSSAQEQAAGIIQLGQALGSGFLQGDELRSIRENAPLLAKAIADEFGVTIGQLKELGSEGEITSERVSKALIKATPEIERAFQATRSTIADSFTRIQNAMTQFIGQADQTQGASRTIVEALNYLADNFDKTADMALKFAGVIASLMIGRSIGNMIKELALGSAALFGFGRAIAGATAAATTASRFGTALTFLGRAAGPIGAVLGVAAAAAIYFTTSANDSEEAAISYAEGLLEIEAAAKKVQTGVTEMANTLPTAATEELRKNQKSLEVYKQRTDEAREAFNKLLKQVFSGNYDMSGVKPEDLEKLRGLIEGFDGSAESAKKVYDQISVMASQNSIFENMAQSVKGFADRLWEAAEGLRVIKNRQNELQNEISGWSGTSYRRSSMVDFGDSRKALEAVRKDNFLEEQRRLELRTEKEKELLRLTEEIIKSAREQGVGITSEEARSTAAGIIAERDSNALISSTAKLIEKFENFSPTAYADMTWRDGKYVNSGYRAGYGSDTIQLADNTIHKITQGMTVTRADADRDLARRIKEFQAVIERQIGSTTFRGFNENQQAALTSIAYNYGSLPERIVQAIKTGNSETIYGAIRGLATDNKGINKDRRNEEAEIFANGLSPSIKNNYDNRENFGESLEEERQKIALLKEEMALLQGLNPLSEEYAQKQGAIQKAQELLNIARQNGQQIAKEISNVEQLLYGDLTKLNPELRAQAEAMREIALAAGVAKAESDNLKNATKDLSKESEKLGEDLKGLFSSFISDLRNGKSVAEAFSNVIDRLLDKLIDGGLDLLLGTGSQSGGGLLRLLFGGGGKGGGGILSMLFGGFFAEGGRPPMGKASIVGERGPELFVPDRSGVVVPNHQLRPNIGQAQVQKSEMQIYLVTDDASIAGIAKTEIQKAAPGIVQVSIKENQKVTKNNMSGYLADTQVRKT